MPATTKARETLTLRDGTDLYVAVNRYVEDHIDEIELNGGALPDDMAAMFDEIDAAIADRVDALAAKIDEFTGYATAAKATEDRAARRRRVHENTIKAMKAYGLAQVERSGADRLRGTVATLRIQTNSAPSTELTAPPDAHQDLLLGLYDAEQYRQDELRVGRETNVEPPIEAARPHPLARFITVQRVATLDKKALAAAYEARARELDDEAQLLGESDIPEDVREAIGPADRCGQEAIDATLAHIRADYIARALAAEFPGVRCTRGHHLRID